MKLCMGSTTIARLRGNCFHLNRNAPRPRWAAQRCELSSSSSPNRIYDLVRDEPSFRTLLLTTTSTHQVLLTLWTASYCPACHKVLPIIKSAIEAYPAPPTPSHPSIAFVEIELDAPDVATGLGVEYGIRGVPTLMAFGSRRGEPRAASRIDGELTKRLGDREWVTGWIRERVEDEFRNAGGAPGGGGGLFGKLFGVGR